jgi:hypothetical protein
MVELDLFVLKRMRQIEGLRNSDYFVHRVVVHRGALYRLFYDRHFDLRLQSMYEEESMKLLQSSTRTPKQLLAKESVWMAALTERCIILQRDFLEFTLLTAHSVPSIGASPV